MSIECRLRDQEDEKKDERNCVCCGIRKAESKTKEREAKEAHRKIQGCGKDHSRIRIQPCLDSRPICQVDCF